jgi:hypothetical protein
MPAPHGIYIHGDDDAAAEPAVQRHQEMLRFFEQAGCPSSQSEDQPILDARLLLEQGWWSAIPRPALVVIHHSALVEWVAEPWIRLVEAVVDPTGLYILFVSRDRILDSQAFKTAQDRARDCNFGGFSVLRQPCQDQERVALAKRLLSAFSHSSSSHSLGFDDFGYACNPQKLHVGAIPVCVVALDEMDAERLCARICEEIHDPQFLDLKDPRVLIAGNDREPQGQKVLRIITEIGRIADVSCEQSGLPVHVYVGEVSGAKDQFNPLCEGYSALVASLVLGLPDVAWHFVALEVNASAPGLAGAHDLGTIKSAIEALSPLNLSGFQPFDGLGLRELLRDHARGAIAAEFGPHVADRIPRRLGVAVAVDDENTYAWFNAFAAYRFGFRSFAVSTCADAKRLLGKSVGNLPVPIGGTSLILEDLFLNFPDRKKGDHFSLLDGRGAGERLDQLPLLEQADVRTLVTSNIESGLDQKVIDRNRATVERGFFSHVAKPYAGIYGLWADAGFVTKWDGGYCPGYVWPPSEGVTPSGVAAQPLDARPESKGKPRLHSAPGKLLLVAEMMCDRARRLESSGLDTMRQAVTCAILATDALELMGNLTPATCAEALRLRHTAEVAAECCFSGLQYDIKIGPRIAAIQKESASLACSVGSDTRHIAALNTEMTVVLSLLKVMREHGQFDECQSLQREVRRLHNRLKIETKMRPVPMIVVYGYLEFILASAQNFLVALLGWGGFFAASFYAAAVSGRGPANGNGSGPLEQAFTAMTGANAFTSGGLCLWNVLTVLAVIVGIAHIGVFLSHMYLLVSRKD